METMEAIPQSFVQEQVFRNLGQVAQYAALTESDKKAYKASLKAYRDAYAIAETERQLGREEGRAEGEAIGIAKGEAKERIKSFKNMVSLGITPEQIALTYNISVDEVYRLVNSNME